MGRDMGHGRDYSEEVAAQVDAEVRALVENAHHEAWEILVEYRDVLDDMVLKLLDKETLGKEEVAAIFAAVDKRPLRDHPTGNGRRPLSSKPPVLTPAELAVMGPADVEDLEDLARGRKRLSRVKPTSRRRTPTGNGTSDGGDGSSDAPVGAAAEDTDTPAVQPDAASARDGASLNRTAEPGTTSEGSTARAGKPSRRRRRATGTDPAS
jgi:cell division protease FtsH